MEESEIKQFFKALRVVLSTGEYGRSNEQFADSLIEFDQGGKGRLTKSVIINMLSRHGKGADQVRINVIQDFVREKYRYNAEAGKFEPAAPIGPKLSRSYNGSFQLLYDLHKTDPVTEESFLNTRVIELENSQSSESGLTGRFTSYGIENGFDEGREQSKGSVFVELGESNKDLMLMREQNPDRRVPSVTFLLRYIAVGRLGALYGLVLGFQSEDTNSIAATRVIGLPREILGAGSKARLFPDDIGQDVYRLISSYLNGKNRYDTASTINAGPDFFGGENRSDNGDNKRSYDVSVLIPSILSICNERNDLSNDT